MVPSSVLGEMEMGRNPFLIPEKNTSRISQKNTPKQTHGIPEKERMKSKRRNNQRIPNKQRGCRKEKNSREFLFCYNSLLILDFRFEKPFANTLRRYTFYYELFFCLSIREVTVGPRKEEISFSKQTRTA